MTEKENNSAEEPINNKGEEKKSPTASLYYLFIFIFIVIILIAFDKIVKDGERERTEREIASLGIIFKETVDRLNEYDGRDGERIANNILYISDNPYRNHYVNGEESAETLKTVGTLWLDEIDKINDDLEEARDKFHYLKAEFEALEKEGEDKEYLMLDLGRQFGVRDGYSQHEATAVNKGKKVVVLIERDNISHIFGGKLYGRVYADFVGREPFPYTWFNGYTSIQTEEYFDVYRIGSETATEANQRAKALTEEYSAAKEKFDTASNGLGGKRRALNLKMAASASKALAE